MQLLIDSDYSLLDPIRCSSVSLLERKPLLVSMLIIGLILALVVAYMVSVTQETALVMMDGWEMTVVFIIAQMIATETEYVLKMLVFASLVIMDLLASLPSVME